MKNIFAQKNTLTTSLLILICLALVIAIYRPGLNGDFVFDDFPNILLNQNLHIQTLDSDSLVSATFSSNSGHLKRPISMFSFALNSYYFGTQPFSYKVINLIIHLLTGLGIFLLSRLILASYNRYTKAEFSDTSIFFLPLIISATWMLHPLNLTSVLYIVQRMTSLSGLFVIAGACFYVWSRSRYFEHQKSFWHIPAGTLLFGMFAVFSKENGILLPLFLFLLEIALFRFRNLEGRADKKIVMLFTVILLLPAIGALLILIFNPAYVLASYSGRSFTLVERILTEPRVLVFYLKMIIFPSIQELGLYHDGVTVSKHLIGPASTLAAILAILGLFVTGLILTIKRSLAGFGILWFFCAHLLESTFIPLELVHEHRNYVAIFGILFSITYLFSKSFTHRIKIKVRAMLALGVIGILAFTTSLRAHQWSDNLLQPIYEARHHPNSARATFSAGRAYANMTIYAKENRAEEAFSMLEKSMHLNKTDILPNISLVMLSYKLNKPVNPLWLNDAYNKLTTYPIHPASAVALQELLKCQKKQCKMSNEEIDTIFKYALNNTIGSKTSARHPDIVSVYAFHVINNKKDAQLGYQLFQEAIRLSPYTAQYRVNLINLLLIMRQYDKVHKQLNFLKNNNTMGRYNQVIASIENDLSNGKAASN